MSMQLALAWFDAFRQRTLEDLALADSFVHTSPFGIIRGRQAYLELVQANESAFYSPTLEVVDTIAGETSVAVRYLVNGNPACDWIYTENGQITRIFSYYHYGENPSF